LLLKLTINPIFADMEGAPFTAASVAKAAADYKQLYYGLKNLAAPIKAEMERIALEEWEKVNTREALKRIVEL
jgi:hypothetical protein